MKALVKSLSQHELFDSDDIATWIIDQSIAIQKIPAPTFNEQVRARYVLDQFEALGLRETRIDELHNVYGCLPGNVRHVPGIMVCAHTDTVFPADTPLTVRREGGILFGPGLGDNSIGVAGLLGLVKAIQASGTQPERPIWFVATSREEGLGDLGGVRLAYESLQNRIDLVINIEGLAYGYVYHAGIAVRRLHIVARAQGGHSWLHFGRASATHAIVQLGAKIAEIKTAENPRTTYNIGMIEGGQSINSIASEAGLWLDLRSESSRELALLEQKVRQEIHALSDGEVTFEIEVVGDRPAGRIPVNHPLIQGALAALSATGIRGSLQIGSTDGNVPLSQGCPTVTVGITRGGNAHRLDEFVETGPVASGIRQLFLLTLAAASHQIQIASGAD